MKKLPKKGQLTFDERVQTMSASDSNRSLQRISELLNGRASTTRREVKRLTIALTSIAAGQRKISVWLWDAQTDKCLQKSFHFGKLNALPSLKIDRAFTLPKKGTFMYGLWGVLSSWQNKCPFWQTNRFIWHSNCISWQTNCTSWQTKCTLVSEWCS